MKVPFDLKKWGIALGVLLFPFFMKAQDVGVMKILNPVNGGCASSSQSIQVIITNYSTSQTNIPVKVEITGSTSLNVSQTYSKILAYKAQDTVTFSTTLNTSSGGIYYVKAYTAAAVDNDRTNDTMKQRVVINVKPTDPVVHDTSRCGPGYVQFNITRQKNALGLWYSNPTGYNGLIDTGSVYNELITKSKKYYVENSTLYPDQLYSLPIGKSLYYNSQVANAFDMNIKKSIFLDSVDVTLNTTAKDSVYIFYKENSASGYEQNEPAWTLAAKALVTGLTAKKPITLKLSKRILLKAGKTYGFYIYSKGGYLYGVYSGLSTADSVRNNDININVGRSTKARFSGGIYYSTYMWQGTVYYSTFGCSSARKSIYARVKTGNTGISLKAGSPFHGLVNAGTAVNPDRICPKDTVVYELTPPDAYLNSDFDKYWTVLNSKVMTTGGKIISSTDTMTTRPTASANYAIRIVPSAKYADSVLVLYVTVKSIVDSCVNEISRYLSVGALPTANFGYKEVCEGQQTTFFDSSYMAGGGFLTRIWSFGDGGTATQSYPTHTYAKPGNYNVTLKVSNAAGCSDIITKSVKVYGKPQMGFKTTPLCVGEVVTFTDTSVTAGKVTSYYWEFTPTIKKYVASPTFTYNKAGTYTVKMAIVVSTGCVDTLVKQIEVVTKPKASFTFNASCVGTESSFTNTSTGDTNMTYYWDFGDGTYSTDKDPVKTFYLPGNNKVTLTVTAGSSGCTSVYSGNVAPFDIPKAKIGYISNCAGNAVSFFDSSNYANSPVKALRWDFGDGDTSNKGTPTHVYTNAGTYVVSLWIENANGCADSTQRAIKIAPLPTADFSATTVCVGQATSFTNNSSVPGGTLTYLWDFGDTTTSSLTNPSHVYKRAGNFSVSLKAMTGACFKTKVATITVNPGPVPTWGTSTIGRKVTFNPDNKLFSTYMWYFGDGDSSNLVSPSHIYPSSTGTYTVTLKVTDDQGCKGERTVVMKLGTGIMEVVDNKWNVNVYPNPFTGSTRVTYTLEKRSAVKLSVIDMQGREVMLLKNGDNEDAGKHEILIDGAGMPSGVYLLKVIVGDQCYNTRIVELK